MLKMGYDQMVQAARSGKQNIAEGSMASGTRPKKLTQAHYSCEAGSGTKTSTPCGAGMCIRMWMQ